ncbi:MAG: M56 family metallopeptidase [Chitinophagaceae bacterium]
MLISQLNILQSLGWSILSSLWQMAFLWVIFQSITLIFSTLKPAVKSFMASSFLITGFLWFIFTFLTTYFNNPIINNPFYGFLKISEQNKVADYLYFLLPLISVVYLVFIVFSLSRYIRNYRYVKIISQYGLQKIQIDWRIFIKKTVSQLGIKKSVQIWLSDLVKVPVTIGFLKPIILIPIAAINNLTTQQLEAVLLHEITHIRRNDFLINLVIQFIQSILFFNPFVKAFISVTEKEREISCDEMVLQFQYNRHAYAAALFTLEKFSFPDKLLLLSATGRKSMLLSRIESIAGLKNNKGNSLKSIKPLIAGLFCIVSLNFLMEIKKPVFGISMYPIAGNSSSLKNYSPNEKKALLISSNYPAIKSADLPESLNSKGKKEKAYKITISENPAVILADYITSEIPVLKKYQEEQVNKTVEVSKKIAASGYWKIIEKSIGEVFSQLEKDELRVSFLNKFNQLDWDKLKNNLKEKYNSLNWDQLNDQLLVAENRLRMDSLQNTLLSAISKLEFMKSEIQRTNNTENIYPSTSLDEIKKSQEQLIKLNKFLKNIENKKMVHL